MKTSGDYDKMKDHTKTIEFLKTLAVIAKRLGESYKSGAEKANRENSSKH